MVGRRAPTVGPTRTPAYVRRAFAAVLEKAKLPTHFTPHGLRHTFASLLLRAGVDLYDVSRMLGHAEIGLTVATYGPWLNPSRPGALEVLDRAERPVTEAEAQAPAATCNHFATGALVC